MVVSNSVNNNSLSVRSDIVTGIDVGGTKIHIADTASSRVQRYNTAVFPSLHEVLENYFQEIGAKPTNIVVGMAGARDDETGAVKLTNGSWPVFDPVKASTKYGVSISTVNDMVSTAAGILHITGIDLLQLKSGTTSDKGSRLVITLSTGIGTSAAVWESQHGRYIISSGEGGHMGFQPKNEEEHSYLSYLHKKYPHASAELALSGKHGIDNLVDHFLDTVRAPHLSQSITRTRKGNRPVGAVLLEYATEGQGTDKQVANKLLGHMGAMLGSVMRDLALAYKATGGVYLTGSVAMALGEYLAENTKLLERFVLKGAVHDSWLEKVPINLVTDPNIAVRGALTLAKET